MRSIFQPEKCSRKIGKSRMHLKPSECMLDNPEVRVPAEKINAHFMHIVLVALSFGDTNL